MKELWNKRYANEEYAYGTAPNDFFSIVLDEYHLNGKLLLPAEGEGRNAVFASKMGMEVTAFDLSKEGKKKALKLATTHQVHFKYFVGELNELPFEENYFDAIALIFAHLPAQKRHDFHVQLSKLLKKGGLMILEGFSKKQMDKHHTNPQAGGPKEMGMLFSQEDIKADFSEFQILKLEEKDTEIDEEIYHQGPSSVIRFIGRK